MAHALVNAREGAQVIVGIGGADYVGERNLTMLPFTIARLRRSYGLNDGLNYVQRKVLRNSHATSFLNTFHSDFGVNKVALLHLINTVSASSTPWVSTYSHYLPRWNQASRYGVQLLAGRACRKLIAISNFADTYQKHVLNRFPAYRPAIRSKMCIVHPSQRPLITAYNEKPLPRDVIECTFVGADFFRKGGMEVLRAVDRLATEGCPIHLNIVSSLDAGDYASQAGTEDVRAAERLIEHLGPAVSYHRTLPNGAVLTLFVKSHIGLLPTYDDIYGYSVLEAQAAGCAVISTDVCALPEINNDSVGWLIPLPKNSFGIAYKKRLKQRQRLSSIVEEQLYSILKGVCANPDSVREKGARALARIAIECRPEDRVSALERVYHEALNV
jgi:glycosyltransferase involved in cell wall biosynthesis